MALLPSEIARIKVELGFNVMGNGAVPWIDIVAIFEQVIQPFLSGGASTTSSTEVSAASAPTPVALTLADATDISAGDRIVVDVDSRQETATIQSLVGPVATVLLSKAHTGTYPVTVEGGETIVREYLQRIAETKAKMLEVYGTGSLKAVDEIEFYGTGGTTQFGNLGDQLMWWRDQLAAALGIQSMWSRRRASGGSLSVY